MHDSFTITPAHTNDDEAVENLTALAFGDERHKRLINRLRAGCLPYRAACYVAKDKNASIIGSIRYCMACIESDEPFPFMVPFLGPLAVEPRLRGAGIGKQLIRQSLQKLRDLQHCGVLIVGDSGYYAPFGFSPAVVENLQLGGTVTPLSFMGLEWKPESLSRRNGLLRFVSNPEMQS